MVNIRGLALHLHGQETLSHVVWCFSGADLLPPWAGLSTWAMESVFREIWEEENLLSGVSLLRPTGAATLVRQAGPQAPCCPEPFSLQAGAHYPCGPVLPARGSGMRGAPAAGLSLWIGLQDRGAWGRGRLLAALSASESGPACHVLTGLARRRSYAFHPGH